MSTLLFTREDVNKSRSSELIRLLRVIAYRLGIDNSAFAKQHYNWCMRVGYQKSKTQGLYNNHRSMVTSNTTMSIKTFFIFIKEWMNFSIVRLSVTLLDPETGKEMVFHSDDIVDDDDAGSHSPTNLPDIDMAIDFAIRNAPACKSAEEKQWLIDQVLRSLTKDTYNEAIKLSPEKWEVGTPPKVT